MNPLFFFLFFGLRLRRNHIFIFFDLRLFGAGPGGAHNDGTLLPANLVPHGLRRRVCPLPAGEYVSLSRRLC